jgi:hypothetical protein
MTHCTAQILISQQNSADTGHQYADKRYQKAFFALFPLLFTPRE